MEVQWYDDDVGITIAVSGGQSGDSYERNEENKLSKK